MLVMVAILLLPLLHRSSYSLLSFTLSSAIDSYQNSYNTFPIFPLPLTRPSVFHLFSHPFCFLFSANPHSTWGGGGGLKQQVGVRLFADAFRDRTMPRRLRMVVFCKNAKPSYRDLHAGMSIEEVDEIVGLWSEHQSGVHASIHSLG